MWDIYDGDLYVDTVYDQLDMETYCEMGYTAREASAQ